MAKARAASSYHAIQAPRAAVYGLKMTKIAGSFVAQARREKSPAQAKRACFTAMSYLLNASEAAGLAKAHAESQSNGDTAKTRQLQKMLAATRKAAFRICDR